MWRHLLAATLDNAKIINPAHSFLFFIIMGGYMVLLHQSTMCIIGTLFLYICDVLAVKSLYITFSIHKEQFAFQWHALRIARDI